MLFDKFKARVASILSWLILHSLYRVRKSGLSNIPGSGPAIIISNHVSYVDALIIASSTNRPVRFMMYWKIYNIPILKWLFGALGAIPIAGRKENESVYLSAMMKVEEYLRAGELVCIFPEGELTKNGEMVNFKPGIKKILLSCPVPVVPSALRGLWGTFFSLKYGKTFIKIPRRLWSRIEYVVGEPLPPSTALSDMQTIVSILREDKV